jgi:hypothetical protein
METALAKERFLAEGNAFRTAFNLTSQHQFFTSLFCGMYYVSKHNLFLMRNQTDKNCAGRLKSFF